SRFANAASPVRRLGRRRDGRRRGCCVAAARDPGRTGACSPGRARCLCTGRCEAVERACLARGSGRRKRLSAPPVNVVAPPRLATVRPFPLKRVLRIEGSQGHESVAWPPLLRVSRRWWDACQRRRGFARWLARGPPGTRGVVTSPAPPPRVAGLTG